MSKTYFEQMRELMENAENWMLFIPDLFDRADKHIERLEAENDRLRRISKVYIVISSRGEYSDYEEYIEKIFLSRQEAVEYWRYSVDERPVFCRYHTLDYSLVEMEVG